MFEFSCNIPFHAYPWYWAPSFQSQREKFASAWEKILFASRAWLLINTCIVNLAGHVHVNWQCPHRQLCYVKEKGFWVSYSIILACSAGHIPSLKPKPDPRLTLLIGVTMVEKNEHASNPSSMSIWGIKILQYASQHSKSWSETDTGGL